MTTIIAAAPANLVVDATAVVADANAVVLHDISAVAPATAKSNVSAYGELQSLIADKSAWEANAYRASNDQLYALLQRCYKLYRDMCADPVTNKQLTTDIETCLSKLEVKPKSTTHTINKIVMIVFGVDRRRVSAYSIALRAALAANVTAENLPDFIRNSGGVEELRAPKSANSKTPSQRASEAKHIIGQHVLAQLDLSSLSSRMDEAKIGARHVLIVTQGAGFTFDINAVLSSDTVVNTALAAFYVQNKAEAAAAEKVEKVSRDSNAQQALIDAAAQSVLQ